MADPRLKQLTIKTGVLKRLTKEKVVYEREAETQRNRIEKIKSENQDDHVIKKQEEVLQECLMMIPDCQRRLAKAYEELKEIVDNEVELKDTKQYEDAVLVIENAKQMMAQSKEN